MFKRIIWCVLVSQFLAVSASANPDSVLVGAGDLRIVGSGNGLVFPDGSVQYKASEQGTPGPQGPAGPANSLSVGTVTTGASGSQAAATITGTAPSQILNLSIPQGQTPQISLATICAAITLQSAPAPSFCKAITAFSITSPAAVGTITQATHLVTVTVPSGTNVTALAPGISHTGTSISPASGSAQDFTNPVVYTVTGSDSSTESYTVTVTVAPWAVCGDVLTFAGENYPTVQIGTQCWFARNLNIGTMVTDPSVPDTSCSSIQKFCYNNLGSNCTVYGGLYTWTHAMCGAQTEEAQGICPSGWHIPSDPEFVTVVNYLSSGNCGPYPGGNYPAETFCGAPAGDRMKAAGLCEGRTPCGDSGFNGLLGGAFGYDSGVVFSAFGDQGTFWTSSMNSNQIEAWRRGLAIGYAGVDGSYFWTKIGTGRSVRCVKD